MRAETPRLVELWHKRGGSGPCAPLAVTLQISWAFRCTLGHKTNRAAASVTRFIMTICCQPARPPLELCRSSSLRMIENWCASSQSPNTVRLFFQRGPINCISHIVLRRTVIPQ